MDLLKLLHLTSLRKQQDTPRAPYIPSRDAQAKFAHWPTQLLDPRNLKALRDSIQSGYLDRQEQLWMAMLQGWPRLRKDLNEIAGAVAQLNWTVTAWADRGQDPTPTAQAVADLVESALWSAHPAPGQWELGLEDLIKSITYATATGQTVHEIDWMQTGELVHPRAYLPLTAQYYAWERTPGQIDRLRYYPDGIVTGTGTDFAPDKYLIALNTADPYHPIFGAKLRTLIGWFGASQWGLPWLMTYCQIFGIPFRVAKARGEQARAEAADMLQRVGSSGWAVTTENFDFEIHDATHSGTSLPQATLLDMADKVCDNLILGQTLTSSNDGGGAYALGKVHQGIRQQIIYDTAQSVANVLNTQLIPAIVRLNYGGAMPHHLPYITPTNPDVDVNLQAVEFVAKAQQAGLKVGTSWAYELLNIPQPGEGDDILKPMQQAPSVPAESTTAGMDTDPIAQAIRAQRGKYLRPLH
jgi:phage gp29-like protein